MNHVPARYAALALALGACGLSFSAWATGADAAARTTEDDRVPPAAAAPGTKPALTVTVARPLPAILPLRVMANGNIAAWQEASVGAESHGLRLAEVRVNVGDVVRRGQLLAVFASESVAADVAMVRAALAEAEALQAEAVVNAARARELQPSGVVSAQQTAQYQTAERTAAARVEAQRAALQAQQLRLAKAQVQAPDDGVISARLATVGAVVPAGAELFRMIRSSRLEWRAEVPAAELAQLRPGQVVRVIAVGAGAVTGRVRMVGPTVDTATRNGLVYVDLPAPGAARAGMFARGEIELGSTTALTLPQSAVLLRDGFHVVLRVGADQRVQQAKVTVGRRAGDRIEITGGIDGAARVVASGSAFLADGDLVRVVASAP